jgi:hypothetical protein
MQNVKVVTAFVPLGVKHMTADAYHELGQRMLGATGGRYRFFDNFQIEDCWSYSECVGKPPATATPADRYASPDDHVRSHIVQHTRTQWALAALEEDPSIQTIIWLDLGILKQGAWLNNQITPAHVAAFVDKVAARRLDDIPFPGIAGPGPINPHGDNWRFCGSTHIWPAQYLRDIHRAYKVSVINFLNSYKSVPLDLAIWPTVERTSGLPFRWYKAEYDASQLENFPCAP